MPHSTLLPQPAGAPANTYQMGRGPSASCRLDLQSSLWNESLGYLIHPRIKLPTENACVADVATGTGIWLVNLQEQLDDGKTKFDGLDIDLAQTPPSAWLPDTINFRQWNAFEEPPSELIGKYDLVHIRLFMINIRNDASRFIENIRKILKPGGWLQWEEVNNLDNEIMAVSPDCKTDALQQCLTYIAEGSQKHVGSQNWLINLPDTLNNNGFEEAVSYRHFDPPRLARYFFDLWLITLTEYTKTALYGTEDAIQNLKMINAAYEECLGGAVLRLGKRVCIARKQQDKPPNFRVAPLCLM